MISALLPERRPAGAPLLVALLASVLLLVGSCASQKHHKAVSLVDYINQDIMEVASVEAHALERYAAVTGENFESEEQVYRTLEDEVIPTYERFFRSLREIAIEEPEIGSLHSIYIRSAGLLLEGFRMKRLALETNDARLMEKANAKIEQGRDKGLAWRARLEELCQLYNVREQK